MDDLKRQTEDISRFAPERQCTRSGQGLTSRPASHHQACLPTANCCTATPVQAIRGSTRTSACRI